MNIPEFERLEEGYEAAFAAAQQEFGGRIDASDKSHDVTNHALGQDMDHLLTGAHKRDGFYELVLTPEAFQAGAAALIGRAVLLPNRRIGAFSPAIFTRGEGGVLEVTMLDQPFDPEVGFSSGQHFGLSLPAQTRVPSFGAHSGQGGFEAGHFTTALAAAAPGGETVASQLLNDGDDATHTFLNGSVPQTAAQTGALPFGYQRSLVLAGSHQLRVLWHAGLSGTDGAPAAGDYPGATRLMNGAQVRAIGGAGIEKVHGLVQAAVAGKRS